MAYSTNHTLYYNKHGIEVPSVTTILKILNKPSLVNWANYLGFKRLNVDEIVNEAARLGTCVHELINSILLNEYIIYISRTDIPDYLISAYMMRFKRWLSVNTVEPILLEKSLSSEKFGGTIDFYGKVNDKITNSCEMKYTIIDFKTSKSIHMSMFFQLAMYCILLEKHGYKVDQAGILLVNNKRDDEKFISRDELQYYIDPVIKLIDFFHDYYTLNNKSWKEKIL